MTRSRSPRAALPPLSAALPHLILGVALLLAGASVFAAPAHAAVIASGLVVRAEGRAPVQGGRADTAHQQALDEAFRRGVLDALRVIAPERQSPHDLETWQETVLSRAIDYVGAWRILSQGEQDGFMTVSAEIEIYRDKLARAARSSVVARAAAAVRVLVLAGALPFVDRAADEEIDAGRTASLAIEAELARRGAVIVSTTDRVPWEHSSGPSSEENRVALAAAAGKRLDADAVLIVQLSRRDEGLTLDAQLIATASESTLASARAQIPVSADEPLAEAFSLAARQVATVCAPRLASARLSPGGGTPGR